MFAGSPGIGKSFFLFFIMHEVAKMDPKPVVVLQIHKNSIYCFKDNNVLTVGAEDIHDLDKYLNDPKTWYLVGDAEVKSSIGN
jgi:hypothetical protein